jgi:hypothetical protein
VLGVTKGTVSSTISRALAPLSADGSKVYFSTTTQAYSHEPITVRLCVTDLATGRSRGLYAPPWQPGLITADPGARCLLVQSQDGGKLVRLNLATGKATALPPGPFALPAVLYW